MSRRRPTQNPDHRRSQRIAGGILLGLTLLGACAGAIVGFTTETQPAGPLYETSAQVRLSSATAEPQVAGALTSPSTARSHEIAETHAVLIRSLQTVLPAVEKHRLHELASFQNVLPQNVAVSITENLSTLVSANATMPGTSLIEITYRSPNVADAMTVLKAVIQTYQDMLSAVPTSSDEGGAQKVAKARDELEAKLQKQRDELQRLTEKAAGKRLPPEDDPNHPERRRRQAQQRRDELDRRRASLQALVRTAEDAQRQGTSPAVIGQMLRRDELFRGSPPTASATGTAPTPLPLAATPLPLATALPMPTATATATALSSLPRPAALDDERSLTGLFDRLRAELASVVEKQRGFTVEIEQADRELVTARELQTQRELLEDEIKETEDLYQAVLGRVRVADLETESDAVRLEIVSPPGQARELPPSARPLPYTQTGVGAALGCLLGLIVVVFYFAFVQIGT